MVQLTRIYTRGGDKGKTSLGDGTRVEKFSPRIEAIGAVDEANATLGMARLEAQGEIDALLQRIQNDLFDLGADLCTPKDREGVTSLRIRADQVIRIEREIDHYNGALQPLKSFVLPGGSRLSATLHLARTVVRRAERLCYHLASLETVNPEASKYLNRLSDLLFVLARYTNDQGARDVLWIPGGTPEIS